MTRALTTGTDLSLMLPAEEDVLGVDMTAFTPAVQLEARECAFKPAPPLGTFHGVDIPPPDEVLGHEHGGAQEHGGTQGSKKEQRGKMSVHGLFGLLTKPGKGSVKKMSKRKKKAAEFVGGDAQQDGGAVTAEAGPHDQQQEPPQDEGKQRQEQQGKDPLVAPTQHETATMPLEVSSRKPVSALAANAVADSPCPIRRSACLTSRSRTSVSPLSSAKVR